MTAIWTMFFSWMPASLQIVLGVFVVLGLIVMILKVIALILDALPFL